MKLIDETLKKRLDNENGEIILTIGQNQGNRTNFVINIA